MHLGLPCTESAVSSDAEQSPAINEVKQNHFWANYAFLKS